jgi:hypothetical protein
MTEALVELQVHLRPEAKDDIAAFESGIALLGAGRELIRLRDDGTSPLAVGEPGISELLYRGGARSLAAARHMAADAAAHSLAELREDAVAAAQAQAASSKIVALAAIRDELERGSALLTGERQKGVLSDAA